MLMRLVVATWLLAVGCYRTGSLSEDPGEPTSAGDGVDGLDTVEGMDGDGRELAPGGSDEDRAADPALDRSGGGRGPAPVTCAEPRDESLFVDGQTLYVDDDSGCGGAEPCFESIPVAVHSAEHGDTVLVLPGTYNGTLVEQSSVGALRIMSRDGPESTVITHRCMNIRGFGPSSGEIWIEGFTFRHCGAVTSTISDAWAVAISGSNAAARIEGNVLEDHGGRGGIGVLSSTVDSRFDVVIARNRITGQTGEDAAIMVDVPAGRDEDYCIRIENNLLVANRVGVNFFYTAFNAAHEQFELVNNTLVDNEVALILNSPTGHHHLVNNIFWGNGEDVPRGAELRGLQALHNLVENGQFTGLNGNFTADPQLDERYRPRAGSPVLGRGEESRAPLVDLEGRPREGAPDVGAFQRGGRAEPSPFCGDGETSFGIVQASDGSVQLFEGCDDGNLVDGDGCSDSCLLEPAASSGLISQNGSALCAVRADGSLQCWGDGPGEVPDGPFDQVAVSAYHVCALRTEGEVSCFRGSGPSFAPVGDFLQLAADYDQTCGLRTDGGVTCWDDRDVTFSRDGDYVRVDTNRAVCAIDAQGIATCWDPHASAGIVRQGRTLQTFPDPDGMCQLLEDGRLQCETGSSFFLDEVPDAALVRVSIDRSSALGLRPDGRVVSWGTGAYQLGEDERFIDVANGIAQCGLTADHRVHCWGFPSTADFPRE
jgi:cysteine-rich repeat protein